MGKPGGKVPSNDLPSGAKVMTVGDRTSVATKGASPDREAPYECLTFSTATRLPPSQEPDLTVASH